VTTLHHQNSAAAAAAAAAAAVVARRGREGWKVFKRELAQSYMLKERETRDERSLCYSKMTIS